MCQLVSAASCCGPLSVELQRWHRRLRVAAHVMAAVFSLALVIGEQAWWVVVRAMDGSCAFPPNPRAGSPASEFHN
jgi:hypothetical protein